MGKLVKGSTASDLSGVRFSPPSMMRWVPAFIRFAIWDALSSPIPLDTASMRSEPFCPFLKNFRCYESHMKVLRKCYRNHSHQLASNARISSYSSVVRCSFAAASSLVASSFIPCAFRERISQQYAFGLSGAMVSDFMAY